MDIFNIHCIDYNCITNKNNIMRNYLICYYAERNDDCVDCEIEIQSENIQNALLIFNQSNIKFKRVTKIEEI